MDINKLENYLKSKKNAKVSIIDEFGYKRFLINDKLFALLHTDKNGKMLLSVKNRKSVLNEYRIKYPETVSPCEELEPLHWNSFRLDTDLSEDMFFKAVDESYRIILETLSPLQVKLLDDAKNELEYPFKFTKKSNKDFIKVNFSNKDKS